MSTSTLMLAGGAKSGMSSDACSTDGTISSREIARRRIVSQNVSQRLRFEIGNDDDRHAAQQRLEQLVDRVRRRHVRFLAAHFARSRTGASPTSSAADGRTIGGCARSSSACRSSPTSRARTRRDWDRASAAATRVNGAACASRTSSSAACSGGSRRCIAVDEHRVELRERENLAQSFARIRRRQRHRRDVRLERAEHARDIVGANGPCDADECAVARRRST